MRRLIINEKTSINKHQQIVKESSKKNKINKINRKGNKKEKNLTDKQKIRIGILKSI